MSRTCPACGVVLPAVSDAFCSECGSSLDADAIADRIRLGPATVEARTPVGPPYTNYDDVPSNRRSGLVSIYVLLGFVCFPPFLWLACFILLTGDVFYNRIGKDGQLENLSKASAAVADLVGYAVRVALLFKFVVSAVSPKLTDGDPMTDYRNLSGRDLRALVRRGDFAGVTPGLALGYVQANLVVLPREQAFDFLLFCQRNPKPCPLLDVTTAGDAEPKLCAPGADIRTDVPRYCVYRNGERIDEPSDIVKLWQKDWVAFLIGCSFTFENALLQAGLPIRHIEAGCNVPMYRTNIACERAGVFHGPMVVSMRPMTPAQAVRAVQICSRLCRKRAAFRSTWAIRPPLAFAI